MILTDTVGFIRDLPKDLVAAFRATLEEMKDADLLLHVVDVSDPQFEHRIEAVETILQELDVDDVPTLLVLNKLDRLAAADGDRAARWLRSRDAVAVSALRRDGLDRLVARADAILFGGSDQASRDDG